MNGFDWDAGSSFDNVKKSLAELHVDTPGHLKAMRLLGQALRTHVVTGEVVGVVVTGKSGSGKTHLLNAFSQAVEELIPTLETQKSPIVRVESPSDITKRSLGAALLKAIGDPFWYKGTNKELEGRFDNFLDRCRPLGIAIDEFHNFPKSRQTEAYKQALADLKRMTNQKPALYILSGTEEINAWIRENDELRGRFLSKIEIPRLDASSDELFRAFRYFLSRVAEIVPYHRSFSPSHDEDVLRMLIATEGSLREIVKLNISACDEADADGEEQIGREHFALAFESTVVRPSLAVNPFRLKGKGLETAAAPFFA